MPVGHLTKMTIYTGYESIDDNVTAEEYQNMFLLKSPETAMILPELQS